MIQYTVDTVLLPIITHIPHHFSADELNKLKSQIGYQLRNLKPDVHADFSSCLFLECLEQKEKTQAMQLEYDEFRKCIGRVQQRIYRSSQRNAISSNLVENLPDKSHSINDMRDLIEDIEFFITMHFNYEHSCIFKSYFIDNRTVSEICRQFDISKTVVYERLKMMKLELKKISRLI